MENDEKYEKLKLENRKLKQENQRLRKEIEMLKQFIGVKDEHS